MQEIASITPKELEVKLEVDSTSLPALNKIPLFRTLKLVPTQSAEVSVYFDTDKQTLRKKGLMLRVRRKGGRYIQTIKASSDSGPFNFAKRRPRSNGFSPAGRLGSHQSRFLFDHSMVCRAFYRARLVRHTAPILYLER
jgi:hypothetical protein